MWNRLMNRLARLGFLLFLALRRSDAVPHTDHHHQHHHHHNNHSLEHGLFTKHIAPITKSSPPSPNSHRAMYQWNDTSNSFHQTYIKLPADAPFLKNEQFFNTYKHVSSINETVDHTQCQWPILMEIFAGRTNGFFVDLASNHWETGSNTVGLEEFYNWKGICVEPTTLYWEGILSNRKCTLVASPVYYENNVQVTFHVNEGLGGIVAAGTDNEGAKENNVVLPTVTLNSIIDTLAPASVIRKAPPMGGTATHRRVIDYFSLDIEGAEYDAMKNFDFDHTVFLVLTIERPKELLHELLVKTGYWFLRNVWRTTPFGEAVYLHYTCPRFVELMTKHRKNPNIRYSNVNVHYNPVYLLRPAWLPMEALVGNLSTITTTMGRDDRIRHQQSVYKLFETFRSTFTSLMMDGDVFKCHRNARQLYYFRGGRAHPIPSMHVFAKLDQGRRDIDEVFVMSPSYCEHLSMGNALDATTATLPPNDPFWSAAAAAAVLGHSSFVAYL